jgi:hypothetical protein
MSAIDDPSVADETHLYHRIPPSRDQIVPDENRGCLRLSSGAFVGKTEMSVVLDDTLRADGRDPSDALANYPGQYLVRFTAAFVRSRNQVVVRSPRADEPAHGDVIGKKTRGVARALAETSCWIVAPEGACEQDYC